MKLLNEVKNLAVARMRNAQAAVLAVALAMAATFAIADAGHDHGEDAPAASGTAFPRVTSHSDLFELVAIVDAGVMTVYLDSYVTNEPVSGATIEVEAGAAKGMALAQPDGTYRFEHAVLKTSGTVPVSFTVTGGKDTDLLAGDLNLQDAHADHEDDADARPWLRWAGYGVGLVVVLALAAAAARRFGRRRVAPLLAACIVATAIAVPMDAKAGPGHDHGEDAGALASGNSPKRLPDGSVFLPKPSQRQLGVRTLVSEEKALPKTVELTGRVVADPNAGGKVQPTQAGRIEPGPRGLPQLGQAVRKGETLALLRASNAAIDRANQVAQTAELRANLELARKRVLRLEQLEGTVAQKDIDAARAEADSLSQRLAAVGASVNATEALVAPVSGVIAAANVVAGQVVEARELLFEIVDPARLMVEASAFDAGLLGDIASASASAGPGASVALRFVGAGRTLREGAIPLQFSTTAGQGAVPLAVGQPVKVILQTRETVKGFAVPTGAVVKNPSNADMVWVHTGAEVFQPRPVRAVALDGATVSVVDGLKAGERVVTQGAPLVNQVR
jgi:RND family efflux transporter MFP subunit